MYLPSLPVSAEKLSAEAGRRTHVTIQNGQAYATLVIAADPPDIHQCAQQT